MKHQKNQKLRKKKPKKKTSLKKLSKILNPILNKKPKKKLKKNPKTPKTNLKEYQKSSPPNSTFKMTNLKKIVKVMILRRLKLVPTTKKIK